MFSRMKVYLKKKFEAAKNACAIAVATGTAILLSSSPAQAVLDPDIAAAFTTLDTAIADIKVVAWASLITIIVIFASMTIFKKFVGKIFGQ